MAVQLQSAPAVAIIDENNNLTLSFSPPVCPDGLYDQYSGWNIRTKQGVNSAVTVTKSSTLNTGETNTSRLYTTVLSAGDYTLTMEALANAIGSPTASNSNWWQTNGVGDGTSGTRAFPAAIGASTVTLSSTSLLLNQQLTVTLNPLYTAADQWRVLWPDGTDTGWLPLTASVVAKSFSSPGALAVVVQSRYDYSNSSIYNPPTTLLRQLTVPIFVMDQQSTTSNAASTGLTTTLGFGGTAGFELIDTSVQSVTPEPWEVIARAIVRDTVTNELKMLVATTRFASASSLLGTMALDVFPIAGRPHTKELLEPAFQLITNSGTTAVPVKIQTTTLPNLIVGKSITDALNGGTAAMTVKTNTGVPEYIWSAVGLPNGVFMGSNGVFSGTPLELGQFNVTFAVQDSGSPFSIDETTLTLTVITDLLVQIAANQKDANGTTLTQTGSTLGVAQVGTPYSVQMAVGNINANVSTPGGLPPYKWSIPSGALPVGLSIDANTGIISGTPCTYNSTTDFSKTFSAVVQVTDAIGAKASTTFTMTLKAEALTIGSINQTDIYATQDFKLVVPVFGGQSPYTLVSVSYPSGEASFYSSSALVDGQVEVVANVPSTGVGIHNFTIQVQDSSNPVVTVIKQISYTVHAATQATGLTKAFVDHYWYNGDTAAATPLAISNNANFSGLVLVSDTIVPSNGITVAVDPVNKQVTFTGPPTAYQNSDVRVPLILDWAEQEVGRISRVYSLLAHNNTTPGTDVGTITSVARPFVIGDLVGLNPRKPYFNSPATIPATLSGASLTARMGAASTLPPGLSLDANTGLVYGVLNGQPPATSNIQYVDAGGALHGTVTVNWAASASNDFSTTNTFVDGQLGTTYDADASPLAQMAPPSGITLTNVSFFNSVQPSGLNVKINASGNAVLYGTPTEAGYFDVWYQLNAASGQTTFVHQRIAIDDPLPMLILNSTLPEIGKSAYVHPDNTAVTLYGFGGTPNGSGQYTWGASDSVNGNWVVAAGSAAPSTGPFVGLSLNTSTGVLSGTLSSPPAGTGTTDLGSITFSCTDSRTALTALSPSTPVSLPATITKAIDLTYTGSLVVSTAAPNGLPTFVAFALSSVAAAVAGNAAYTFTTSQASAANNAYVGKAFTVTGFNGLGPNNGTFLCTASSSTTLTLANGSATSETAAANAGLEYAFYLRAVGGNAATYSWSITAGSLPGGITLTAASGLVQGAWNGTAAPASVTFQVTDGTLTSAAVLFNIRTGTETLSLDGSSWVNKVDIGTPYLGALLATNIVHGTTAAWQVAPTTYASGGPHGTTLPAGLRLLTDNNPNATEYSAADNGETGSLAGTYTGSSFSGRLVRCVCVDANGNTGSVILNLTTGSNLAITDPTPLPSATATVAYSYQLHVIGGQSPYTWSIDPSTAGYDAGSPTSIPIGHTPPDASGLTLSSAGLISGTASTTFTNSIVFKVTDNLGNSTTAALSLTVQPFGLVINTAGPLSATSGRAYTTTLTASGVPGTDNLVWSISPVSVNQLPTGLSLSAAGVISGTTNVTGYDQQVTFRVTDTTLNSYADKAIEVKVLAGLTLQSGIDYTDSLNTGILGYIDNGSVTSISPRPNQSFLVIASGVVSTSPSSITVATGNPNITATVTSLDTTKQVAIITLAGSTFAEGTPGTYSLPVTVTDSGVTVSATFSWVVYSDGVLRAAPSSGSFPTQLISGQ